MDESAHRGMSPEEAAEYFRLNEWLGRDLQSGGDSAAGLENGPGLEGAPRTARAVQEELFARILLTGTRVRDGEAADSDVETLQRLRDELSASFGTEHPAEDPNVQRAAVRDVLDETLAEHNTARTLQIQASDRWPGATANPSYENDPRLFEQAFQAARERAESGEPMVPYMLENATGGLGARNGGRGFGLELEFDVKRGRHTGGYEACRAIARDLYEAGLSSDEYVHEYHASAEEGYSDTPNGWRLEEDCTVDGELVSPILYDEPSTWRNLATVCEIIRSHGGTASVRTGGHVHVGMHDYDHDTENHHRLMSMYSAYEDVLFRLAQNPAAFGRMHRGIDWCRPNYVPDIAYNDFWDMHQGASHGNAVNLSGATGWSGDHAEFRLWDGSLEPGVIQTQINLSLGLTAASVRDSGSAGLIAGGDRMALGERRRHLLGRGLSEQRLTGSAWNENTRMFRRLMDDVFPGLQYKDQATALFAATSWQDTRWSDDE
ncbi:amidoligase family protein [Embleya sp. MST-111070]|uniref:amidoligase family protein n=1 Tax=Embleya sp. MST-111070 TaxID=3398231 RepID=UPI003F741FBE